MIRGGKKSNLQNYVIFHRFHKQDIITYNTLNNKRFVSHSSAQITVNITDDTNVIK